MIFDVEAQKLTLYLAVRFSHFLFTCWVDIFPPSPLSLINCLQKRDKNNEHRIKQQYLTKVFEHMFTFMYSKPSFADFFRE